MSDRTLLYRTDAKTHRMEYSYDAHQRVTQVRRKPLGGAEDTCQQVNYTCDTPQDGSFTYTFSRLATVTWGGASCTGNYSWAEWYSYTQAGLVLKKRLRVTRAGGFPGQRDLDGTYTYDNEGKMTSVNYPATGTGPTVGPTYTYGFDNQGRPVSLTDSTSQIAAQSVVYGRRTRSRRCNTPWPGACTPRRGRTTNASS